MKKNKKNYLSPTVTIVELKQQRPLLAGSGEQLQKYRNGGTLWDDEEE